MSATVVAAASVTVDVPRRGADAAMLAADPHITSVLGGAVTALLSAIAKSEVPTDEGFRRSTKP